jgi:ribonucleoside-diphosphate reductase alpha chain
MIGVTQHDVNTALVMAASRVSRTRAELQSRDRSSSLPDTPAPEALAFGVAESATHHQMVELLCQSPSRLASTRALLNCQDPRLKAFDLDALGAALDQFAPAILWSRPADPTTVTSYTQ